MYISSCVDVVPIVVSVPINTKCLSGVDTSVCIVAVGALAIIVARVDVDPSESHSKVAPSNIVAISLFPKLSKAQSPGAVTISPVCEAPHFV